MTSRLGVRLLTGSALQQYMDRLPTEAYEQCRYHYENDVGNDGSELIKALRKRYRLEPALLAGVTMMTVEPCRTTGRLENGQIGEGYFASARVPFQGSREFLRTTLSPAFKARFRGRFTKGAVNLVTHLVSLDLEAFRDEAQAEVVRMNQVLNAFRPEALAWDDTVRDQIERIVATF